MNNRSNSVAMSDGDLLAAALRGDDRAWPVLEARLRDQLLRGIRRRARRMPEDLHEEVLQEVWTAVWLRATRVPGGGYDPAHSAPDFVGSFVSNALRRVRANNRPAGATSRLSPRQVASSAARPALVPKHRWDPPLPSDPNAVSDIDSARRWEREQAKRDAGIDVARAGDLARKRIAHGITLVLSGLTIEEAAPVINLKPTTFRRRLRELAALQQAA